jgi:hypothetical protein
VTGLVRVYVNAEPVDVAPGATALDCVRAWRAAEADAVAAGTRRITDSRGLPVAVSAGVQAGAIMRTVAARSVVDA